MLTLKKWREYQWCEITHEPSGDTILVRACRGGPGRPAFVDLGFIDKTKAFVVDRRIRDESEVNVAISREDA